MIRTLCSGTPAEQLAAIDGNFTHDASFRHTICRVPSFGDVNVPLLGAVNSRWVIGCIYRWYKVLSPRIEVDIESVGMYIFHCIYEDSRRISCWGRVGGRQDEGALA